MNELFWQATEEERIVGHCYREDRHHCLLCDFETDEGYVYPEGKAFVNAKKKMSLHIEEAHGSVFDYLTTLDKKLTGLSAHQSKIMKMFYDGLSDYDIQKAMNIGSISTIRNHRYALKEKEKQAKTMSTMMELLARVTDDKKMPVKPHVTATMVDDRYDITEEKRLKILEKYFPDGLHGRLTTFYTKEKNKIIILGEVIKRFESVRRYNEKEVDELLKLVYEEDYVLMRRYLIQYGFLDRERDGSVYWVKETKGKNKVSKAGSEKKIVDKESSAKKKELTRAYKTKQASEKIKSGVYQVRNMLNGKIYLATARNISKLEGIKFQLNNRSFMNLSLQEDWNALGKENFAIEVLESFEEGDNQAANNRILREMEQKWLAQLQPFGDKGYHRTRR